MRGLCFSEANDDIGEELIYDIVKEIDCHFQIIWSHLITQSETIY
jgi:hypothetical protein